MANSFRETMWFKMGEVREDEGDEASVPLPIEDRYTGRGVTAEDSKVFSLRTGTTEHLAVLTEVPSDDVAMKSLVNEMKFSKKRIVMVAASLAAVCSMLALYVG